MEDADLGPLFQLPQDPHTLGWIGATVALAAIAVLAAGLVRGRLPVRWLGPALGLPLAAYGVGCLFLLEESKSVAFCGSCHETMGPIVRALDEDDGTLSSSHWRRGAVSQRDACYQCHSGYGIWGQVDAKRAGVMHMVRTVTGGYELPIRARRFDNASCLGCHGRAIPFREIEEHRDPEIQAELLSGAASCAGGCHEAGHPERALWGSGGPPPGEGS